MNKNEFRKLSLKKRKNIEPLDLSGLIAESHLLDSYNNIGIYYPIGNEIKIDRLKEIYPDKSFYLPITRSNIDFVKYEGALVKGPFNTMEPTGDVSSRDAIECFLIPCVGVDGNNKRIGYGKGYYDRYLEGYKGLKVGVVYSNAITNDALCDEYDVKLDYLICGDIDD